MRIYLLTTFFAFVSFRLLAQTIIYTGQFSGSTAPAGWTIINNGTGNNLTFSNINGYTGTGSTGTACMELVSHPTEYSDSWAFLPGLVLSTTKRYRVNCYLGVRNNGFPSWAVFFFAGLAPNVAAQDAFMGGYDMFYPNYYLQVSNWFTPISNTTHHFAFRVECAPDQDIARFDYVTVEEELIPLPIDLAEFGATAKGALNLIEWVTASERNTAFHVLEHSEDGINGWEQVAKVKAAGTTSQEQNYSAQDIRPYAKTYYRLRSVDFDGVEDRSSIVIVQRKASGIFGVTAVYPSPTSDYANVQFEVQEEAIATIQVFDFTGRMVLEQQMAASKGMNIQSVNLITLDAGVYSVQVRTETEISAQTKLMKQ